MDNAPAAANGALPWYETSGEAYRLHWRLIAAREAYRQALRYRDRVEPCFRDAAGGNLAAILLILAAHYSFKEASQRYEAMLVDYISSSRYDRS